MATFAVLRVWQNQNKCSLFQTLREFPVNDIYNDNDDDKENDNDDDNDNDNDKFRKDLQAISLVGPTTQYQTP